MPYLLANETLRACVGLATDDASADALLGMLEADAIRRITSDAGMHLGKPPGELEDRSEITAGVSLRSVPCSPYAERRAREGALCYPAVDTVTVDTRAVVGGDWRTLDVDAYEVIGRRVVFSPSAAVPNPSGQIRYRYQAGYTDASGANPLPYDIEAGICSIVAALYPSRANVLRGRIVQDEFPEQSIRYDARASDPKVAEDTIRSIVHSLRVRHIK